MVRRSVTVEENLNEIDFEDSVTDIDIENGFLDVDLDDTDGVLLHNKRKYAVGLIWLSLSELDGDDSIYKKAKAIGTDFYCTRTFIPQSGFGSLKKNHRIGMPSAAVMAADTLIGEWHGVFRADNGWLYVAVHSDALAPDGDKFFIDETECYNHFIRESKKYKWPKTYVPSAWNFAENDGEILLEQLLDAPIMATLRPVSLDALFAGKANKNITFIALLLFVGFIALSLSSQAFMTAFLPEREDISFTPTNLNSNLMSPPKINDNVGDPVQNLLNQTKIINPGAAISNCLNTFDTLMTSVPGWNLTIMRCRGNFTDATWQRATGSIESLRDNIDQFPSGVIKTYSANGDFIASSIMKFSDGEQDFLKLSKREETIILLNNRFSNIAQVSVQDVAAEIVPEQANNSPLANDDNIVFTLRNLPSLRINIITDTAPSKIIENFNIPGLTFNLIEWDIINGSWLYDMSVYLYPENYRN